jgi:CMP-N,N'-diacetyllegionaminic acid synthase
MRILALIPARSGSKRLPGKNVKPLGGKPLIAWSIETARQLLGVCDILVSTDDEAVATISRSAGVLVPWLRPAELATDTASSVDVALHALDWYENAKGAVDGLLLLQPTSPFRQAEVLQRGIAQFVQDPQTAVIGFSPSPVHPEYCFTIEGRTIRPIIPRLSWTAVSTVQAYTVNGAFYLISPANLRTHRAFLLPDSAPLLMDGLAQRIDIDTEVDWRLAELFCEAKR